jgi:hypothetical protein
VDFDKHNPIPTAELGKFVKFSQVIGDLIVIVYETADGFNKVGLFKIDNKYIIDDQEGINEPFGYSILDETNQII